MIAIWAAIRRRFAAVFRSRTPAPPVSPYSVVLNGIAERVVTCATTVSNTLGSGLPEVVYENALAHELRKAGLTVCQQHNVVVYYEGAIVGDYTADLLVEDTVLVELKALTTGNPFDIVQCRSSLKATGHALSLLLNFGNRGLRIEQLVNGP
jgi:GxxExxY protein